MLLGMAQGQVAAVAREVGHVLLYVPVVRPDEFDVAISYLVRRLEENASSDNFLSAAFELATDRAVVRARARPLPGIGRARRRSGAGDRTEPHAGPLGRARRSGAAGDVAQPSRRTGGRGRRAHRGRRSASRAARAADDGSESSDPRPAREPESAREAGGETEPLEPSVEAQLFGGQSFVETAVFARRESGTRATGAPGFRNSPDSDPALPANREWARGILSRIEISTAGDATIHAAEVTDEDALEATIARVRDAAALWGAKPAADRSAVLVAAARALEARRAELIEVAASETGKVLAEADVEVSEAVDFANYYAATARELDRVSGAVFVPSRVTVVTPPWNFPLAIPAGGVLAALAAGSGVVFKPAHQARRCGAVLAEALWEAGVPRDLLALVSVHEGALGEQLVSHPDVDRVILTGSWETAALFRSWRPELPLLAETSGKNAIIVMPSADLDLAASDLVKSAFGHAGQKCSAASLAILVGSTGRSKRFARQLVDATTSLRIGPADRSARRGRSGHRGAARQARVGAHDARRRRGVARRAAAAGRGTGDGGPTVDPRHPDRRAARLPLPP